MQYDKIGENMSVLVTGATGTVGSVIVSQLVAAGLDVRAFTRSPEKAAFAPGVTPFKGELLDVDALRAAMDSAEAVFLLSPVVPDELNVTISALNLCREAKIKAIAYLSVFRVEETADVPHFASKFAAERMIAKYKVAVLEIQRRLAVREALGPEIYEVVAEDVLTGESGAEL